MQDKAKNLISKPPVVVIMGHIDSGKTTLLDQIRKSRVAEKETGGITQHIGVYQVEKAGKKITFIDTPGHEAFSQMRSRGAKTADIAVLVIDSCKGVEAQTKEVISHIKNFEIPTIVALNKTDRPEADPKRARNELQNEGIILESLGGKIPSVEISAKTGEGIEDLLDMINLISEMHNLQADVSAPASGVIIESYLDNQRGPTATLILNNGSLKRGDIIGTLSSFGKIKILEDFGGRKINQIMPGDPAICLGMEEALMVGEKFQAFPSLEKAKENLANQKNGKIQKTTELKEDQKALNIILKTDVLGSIEAIKDILEQLPQEKILINILKSEVGDITENDITLAQDSRGLVLGFRVAVNPIAKKMLQREEIEVSVKTFNIIYDLVEEVRKFMTRYLNPKIVRVDLAKMKVLKTFWSKKNRQIVGGRITEGEITKGVMIEVSRDEEIIDNGRAIGLQRNKKSIEKAGKGEEVGILYEGSKRIEKEDLLTAYKKEREKAEL